MCVQGLIQGFEFWEGGLQSSVLTWRGCIAYNYQGESGGMLPQIYFLKLDALRLILRHSGGTSSQF